MKYHSPTKPMKHQIEARRRLSTRPRRPTPEDVMAYLMDMGTGKSKVILDEWQDLITAGDITDLLVVAPAGSYKNWCQDKSDDQPSELRAHLDPALLKKVVVGMWVSGGGVGRRRELERMLETKNRPRAFFVNVEALSSVGKAREACRKFLSAGKALFVVDESTCIRNRSKRTKAILELRGLARARRILTGLVTPKSPMDLFYQFMFLDGRILGLESDVAFRSRYAVTERICYLPRPLLEAKLKQRYKGTKPIGAMDRDEVLEWIEKLGIYVPHAVKIKEFRRLDELQAKIAPYSYRVLKEDCLDLKPKIYTTRDVELTDVQKRMYDEMMEFSTTELEASHVTATIVIDRMIKLQQIVCGHARDEENNLIEVPSNRLDALVDVLDDHVGKAVIWVTYRHELAKIVGRLEKEYGPGCTAQFHGGNKGSRDAEERRYLSDPKCLYMVSTPSTGGKGNTWVNANLTVYVSNSYDLELRAQSEDRMHRRGQKRSVTYVDLVARGTVDEVIIKSLRKKIDLATAITGENYREWLI